uniref:Uncharacterized protein n=1 Tax=Glossina austeni TaxID=7395 RepID=A0A1A9VLQ5_GLOAU
MKFWIILTLLAISTRVSIATFFLTNALLRGVNAGLEETIGVGIGPAKFGLSKKINVHLGRLSQQKAHRTQDYPNYNQKNYTTNYPHVPAPRHGRWNDQANYTQVPGLTYGQRNYSANYPQVHRPRYGQRNYSANYPKVPGPRYGERNYSANYPKVPVPKHGHGDYQANYPQVPLPYLQLNLFFIMSILLAMSAAYGAAVPLLGIGLNLGVGANAGLGAGEYSRRDDYGSPHRYLGDSRERQDAGVGVGIGAGIGLGAGLF